MIWVIANSIEEDGSYPTYRHYKKAFADNEIDIYCAKQDDDFSFLNNDDIVLIRTRDENINRCVKERWMEVGFKSTLESERTNLLTHDKELVKAVLRDNGIPFPKTIHQSELVDYKTYFVKSRYGENSQGIDEYSKCNGIVETYRKSNTLLCDGIMPIIEEYIDGEDFTTAVIYIPEKDKIFSCSCIIHPETKYGFHSFDSKLEFAFSSSPFYSEELEEICIKCFKAIGAKHYLRIDSRIVGGTPYILDINMLAGLGPVGHMSKCMEMNGCGYYDFIRMVVNSAT